MMMEGNNWLRFTLGVLATWRVTHLLANEDGPADIILHIRKRLGNSVVGALMDCFNCLSLWIAALLALILTHTAIDCLLYWLSLSGAACLLERLSQKTVAVYPDAKQSWEEEDRVLWTAEKLTED
jgi:hypothetical protein